MRAGLRRRVVLLTALCVALCTAAVPAVSLAASKPSIHSDRMLSECAGKGGAERAGCEAPILEEEREAKAKEETERPGKEAAARAAHEQEIREAGERTGREAAEREAKQKEAEKAPTIPPLQCIVPSLKGDSLTAARTALAKAHCKLGNVSRPRGHHKTLIVTRQSVTQGKTLAPGAPIALTLRPPSNTRRS